MARKTSDNGTIIQEKKNPLDLIKYLTKWLCNRDRNEIELTNKLEEFRTGNTIKEINFQKSFITKRALSYCYNDPHIIWYVNKYMNNLFSYNKLDIVDILKSIAYIMDMNNYNKSNQLFYLKSNDLKDDNKQKVKTVIKNYFNKILNKHINDMELNFIYSLFLHKEITSDEVIEMDKCVNGESKLKLSEVNEIEDNEETKITEEDIEKYVSYWKTKELPTEIDQFCQELKEWKKTRPECQNCKLFNNPMVVLDTNAETFQDVHFAFFALNPGSDEVTFGKPLVGRAGTLWRRKMALLPEGTKWLAANVMLCFTSNQKDIGKNDKEVLKVANNCQGMAQKIFEKFKSIYYVPMGNIAMTLFGVTGSILSKSGDVVTLENGCKIIPLIHPSALLHGRGGNSEKAFDIGFQTIYTEAKRILGSISASNMDIPEQKKKIDVQSQVSNFKSSGKQFYLAPEKMINEITENLTLFDIVDLDGRNVLLTFIDENGTKLYKIEEYKIPIYINQKEWNETEILTSEKKLVCYIDGHARHEINQAIKDNIQIIKRSIF